MSKSTRRRFLKRSAMALAAAGGGSCSTLRTAQDERARGRGRGAGGGRGADLALVNGRVYTVNDRQPRAEAFAILHGRFVAVGDTRTIRELITPRTRVIDAEGMTVTPGFIDAHSHPASSGIDELREVDCNQQSISDIKAALATRARKTPGGEWVYGFKYDDTKLRDGRPLMRSDLDDAVPGHPVRVIHRGGHTAILNSRAFELAKVDRSSPDPVGGRFGRDEKGELTGFVAEKALNVFRRVMGREPVNPAQRQAGVKLISQLMTAAGLTSVHDASTSLADFVAYQDALAAGEMLFRVYAMVQPGLYAALKSAGIRTGFGDARLRVGGLKLFADGSCSERTMRMSTPYEGRPNDYGILTTTQDELDATVEDAHTKGFQVGVHANGDVAIDMVLKAYERVLRLHPRDDSRHRIEHCTLVNRGLLERMRAIGAIPTPFYTYVHFHGNKWKAYGQKRLDWMFAHRSFLDHDIRVAAASDYVPGPYEPLMAIQSMVTRKDFQGRVWGPRQRITVEEALRVCTINGAYASFEEDIKGSISVGKLADFVILGADPHATPPDRIKRIKVVQTVVGGETVHSA